MCDLVIKWVICGGGGGIFTIFAHVCTIVHVCSIVFIHCIVEIIFGINLIHHIHFVKNFDATYKSIISS